MSMRLPSLKKTALTLAGLIVILVAWLLFAWLALPGILQSQAEKYVAEKSGHRLTLDRPEFNPLNLTLRLANLRLDDPQGKPLLAFRALTVDLSAASLLRRAFVFDGIRLEEPEAHVVLERDGSLNWTPLIEALKSKEEEPDKPLPRLDIDQFALTGGHVEFTDQRAGFASRIEPLDVELTDISTLPDTSTLPDGRGRYQLTARTSLGAQVHWQGEAELNPIAASGHIAVDGLELARLAPYLKEALPAPPAGVAGLSASYRVSYADGKLGLSLENLAAHLKDLRLPAGSGPTAPVAHVAKLEAKDGRFDLAANHLSLGALTLAGGRLELPRGGGAAATPLQLAHLAIDGLQADLAKHQASVARIALQGGQLQATRSAQGRLDILDALQSLPASPAKKEAAPAGAPWHFKADKLEVAGLGAAFRDESVAPAAEVALDDIRIAIDKLSDDLKAPLPVRAACKARADGSFSAEGQVVPAPLAADLKLDLADLALKPAQPYLAGVAKLALAEGTLTVQGRATYDGKAGPAFQGGFALNGLKLTETDTGNLFLALKSLSSRSLSVTPARLDMDELVLDGLDTSLLIAKDKSINVARVFRKTEAAAAAPVPAPAPAAEAPAAQKAAPGFVASIDRLRIRNSEMDFADESLALPFGTRIHHLRGTLVGLSSRPGAPGQVELDGQVDDYGLARAVGQIDLFNPTNFTDLKVVFRNVQMSRLTPYSATFAGRKIDSGKLSLDLEYKINKRQLEGQNQVVMDQLILGERVDSPTAKDLPLDLAVALLQDSDGRIDLGLPVSGNLDDPQFSYGGIVWKAILNVLGKIATAPFRALGALFGGGEKFESIAFEAGASRLTPPEQEKIMRLANALYNRPGLALTIHGVWAETDRVALQDRQLRRTVAEKAGQQLEDKQDPGPLSTRNPRIQSALESLYADRIGGSELAALKEGFRKANPGQLEEGVAGKMMSRLTSLFREKKTLGEEEVAQLKGADFHAVLYERLREREQVPDDKLQALAQRRGENAQTALKDAGAPMERVSVAAPEKVEASGRDVPVKLVLGTAPKTAAATEPAPATN